MPKPTVNLRLKMAIAGSGVKQQRIAFLAKVNETDLSKYIHGRRVPSPKERERLAKVLGKPERDLFA